PQNTISRRSTGDFWTTASKLAPGINRAFLVEDSETMTTCMEGSMARGNWRKRNSGSLTRRSALKGLGGAGIAALATPGLALFARGAQAADSIVSWASAGQRWEFPQRGVYPLFQKKFPNIQVQLAAEPI